jgi:hypothetical protein
MTLNARTKGQTGEREIADMLNYAIYTTMKRMGYDEPDCLKGMRTVQRNQMQSAVGGNDLTNCFGLSVEVKRQETLAIPEWWRQTVAAASRNNEVPVLIYRQNRKAWHVRLPIHLPIQGQFVNHMVAVGETDIETFKAWFGLWVEAKLKNGYEVKV